VARCVSFSFVRVPEMGDGCGDVLRQEELELLVRKLAQLRAEHIVDSDMVCIASARAAASVNALYRVCGHAVTGAAVQWLRHLDSCYSRKIGHC